MNLDRLSRFCAPAPNTCFLWPPESKYQTTTRPVESFLHSSWKSVRDAPFPLKIAASHGRSGPPHLVHGTLSQLKSPTQTVSHRFSHFCRAYECGRQTDDDNDATRSITTGRIYVRSTAMRPSSHKLIEGNLRISGSVFCITKRSSRTQQTSPGAQFSATMYDHQGCGVLIFLWDSDSDSRVLKSWDSDSSP